MNQKLTTLHTWIAALLILALTVSCSEPKPSPTATLLPTRTSRPTATPEPPLPTETPMPEPAERIGIRNAEDGSAEFYYTSQNRKFIPRGVNYLDYVALIDSSQRGGEAVSGLLAVDRFDKQRIREAFRSLAGLGYNTVRIVFDQCGSGPNCIGLQGGVGLNPAYMDNLVNVMHLAREEKIYLILASHQVPVEGGYWQDFEQAFESSEHGGFDALIGNAYYLHQTGIELQQRYWHDLMKGLSERQAPFEVVLGWELQDEVRLYADRPPLSLQDGIVQISNTRAYNLADPKLKSQMVADGLLFWMDALIPEIKSVDLSGLVTVGFSPPDFPNTAAMSARKVQYYADTAPLLDKAMVDFFDFHAYSDFGLTIQQIAENFGILSYRAKPVILGATGMGKDVAPSAISALSMQAAWIGDACTLGYDGWMYWTYDANPNWLRPAYWSLLEDDGWLLKALAPQNWSSICEPPDISLRNVALGKKVYTTSEVYTNTPDFAVDGSGRSWRAEGFVPQWLKVDFQEVTTVGHVGLIAGHTPPGEAQQQVFLLLAGGRMVLVGTFNEHLYTGKLLAVDLPAPLNDVWGLQVNSISGTAHPSWVEVEAIEAAPSGEPCLVQAAFNTELRNAPDVNALVAGRLYGGNQAVAIGQWTAPDGVLWWQLPVSVWARSADVAASQSCAALPVIEYVPSSPTVEVTFVVQAPASTQGDIYLVGDWGADHYPVWNPAGIVLQKAGSGVWKVTLDLLAGATIQYTYTLGDWNSEERDATCEQVASRSFHVPADSAGETINDVVLKWADLDCSVLGTDQ